MIIKDSLDIEDELESDYEVLISYNMGRTNNLDEHRQTADIANHLRDLFGLELNNEGQLT